MSIYSQELNPESKALLQDLNNIVKTEQRTCVGYPCNTLFDYSELYSFLDVEMNNIGDPFKQSNFRSHTHNLEREVIEFFADLTGLTDNNHWGYVNNGGSEGVLFGLYLARESYPNAVAYYSDSAHYCVEKALKILNITSIKIPAHEDGEFNYEKLANALIMNNKKPAIICATIGTTMTGAVDNIPRIKETLKNTHVQNYYIHADAALQGMIEPFTDNPRAWDFSAGVHSISVSGHKMIGSPIPCGVFITRQQYVNKVAREVEYVKINDATLLGSRNSLTPLFMWYAIKRHGKEGFTELIKHCISTADYLINKLHSINVYAWRNDNSNTVVIKEPPAEFLKKWQIACHNGISHIITMPQVTEAICDEIVDDLDKILNKK